MSESDEDDSEDSILDELSQATRPIYSSLTDLFQPTKDEHTETTPAGKTPKPDSGTHAQLKDVSDYVPSASP